MNEPSAPETVSRNIPVAWFVTVTRDAGQHRALRVDDPAAQFGRALLRGRGAGEQQGRQTPADQWTHH